MSGSELPTGAIRNAWHDATCPEGLECPDRRLHAMSLDYMVVPLVRFLAALPQSMSVPQAKAEALEGAARDYEARMRPMDPNWRRVTDWLRLKAGDHLEDEDVVGQEPLIRLAVEPDPDRPFTGSIGFPPGVVAPGKEER